MTRKRTSLIVLASLIALNGARADPAAAACGDTGVALQILGSGGPFGQGRASAGYVVWIDGVSRLMVDAGGGTFSRFHEAGARVEDLDLLALSHFHPDHASELPALVWTRSGRLRVAGPSGTASFPSVDGFVDGLFGPSGVFRVVSARMTVEPIVVDVTSSTPVEVLSDGDVRVRGVGVPHGDVPTVAYRVDVGSRSVAFSSDQVGTNPAFVDLVRGVDLLVVHFAASEETVGRTAELHARPSTWGQVAAAAEVGTLVLSHLSASDPTHPRHTSHSGADLDGNVGHLRSRYDGPLVMAEDLLCLPIE